jgi:glycoside hydrolase-like protein
MRGSRSIPAVSLLLPFVVALYPMLSDSGASSRDSAGRASRTAYLGFDRNIYPGDDAFPVLRKTFSFSSYWLSPPPEEKVNTWRGKRELLRSQGFGFAVLYRGRPIGEIKIEAIAKQKGTSDAHTAATAAKAEGFAPQTIIFLDVEEGGRLPPTYHAYLRAWTDALAGAAYRSGVYCSAIPVNEGGGVAISTADDIRSNIGAGEIVYWVFNDVCPPSPGCAAPRIPPPISASGAAYAAIWQTAQSPRRKERTARCATTYHADGNCYAPGDTAHAWLLDVDVANSSDPSAGVKQ